MSQEIPEVIIITKLNDEQFILNGERWDVIPATCTNRDLEKAMGAVAKELLPEVLYDNYCEMIALGRVLTRR